MKEKRVLLAALIVLLALSVTATLTLAQGPTGTRVRSPRALLGTGFTYQGQLKNNGTPVNGTCDFRFGLWDAASLGSQIATTVTVPSVIVTNGLFTAQIDFGTNAFNGDARYLGIAVACPSGGSYTAFDSRQALTPAPMALALPGLYTQQNVTSTNVIGGYSGNIVSPGVVGAVIAGGGRSSYPNTVSGDFGTVGGGFSNIADGPLAVICGGGQNEAHSEGATIGGGFANYTPSWYVTIGGGRENRASNTASTISGGWANGANGAWSTVGGGRTNYAYADYSTISGGQSISVTGSWAAVGGGQDNTASAGFTTISGGSHNSASGYYATIPGGGSAVASLYGQMSYASGGFSGPNVASGDAQTSVYVLRNTTSDATLTPLYLDGSSQLLTIGSGRTLTFDILVVARTTGGSSAGYRAIGVIKNQGGTTAFIGSPTVTTLGEDVPAWDATVVADDANDALQIQVTGAAATTIRWVATVRTVEVSY